MTWGQLFGTVLVAGIFGVLGYLAWTDARERQEALRLGRIEMHRTRINQVRRDPSPQPRRRVDA